MTANLAKKTNSKKDFKTHLNFLIKNKMDFTLKISNYTGEIICQSMPFFNIRYFAHEMPKITYLAYNKIKKDLLTWSANDMPQIDKYNCVYFDISEDFEKITSKVATNFDLSSAYTSILYNNFFISKDTFEFLAKLPKDLRLASVGMLASNKDIFIYQDGKPILSDKIVNPLENYFFYCLDMTSTVMRDLKAKLENDFLFSWVDSVYYLPSAGNDFVVDTVINNANLKGKFTPLESLKIINKSNGYKVTFWDTIKEKEMEFNLPKKNKFKEDILYFYGLK